MDRWMFPALIGIGILLLAMFALAFAHLVLDQAYTRLPPAIFGLLVTIGGFVGAGYLWHVTVLDDVDCGAALRPKSYDDVELSALCHEAANDRFVWLLVLSVAAGVAATALVKSQRTATKEGRFS